MNKQIKITLLSLFGVLMALGMTTCIENENSIDVSPERNSFTLQCFMPGVKENKATDTRTNPTPATPEENKISSMFAMFFEKSPSGTGNFLGAIDIDANYPITSDISEFQINLGISNLLDYSQAYNMRVVANYEFPNGSSVADLNDIFGGGEAWTENEVVSFFNISTGHYEYDPENLIYQLPFTHDRLIMSASTIKNANQDKVAIELDRMVTRIDVENNYNDYTLVSASIWNGTMMSMVFPSPFVDYTLMGRHRRLGGVLATNNKLNSSLYTFENYVANPRQGDNTTTCVIIGLRDNNKNRTMYYRVNILPKEKLEDIGYPTTQKLKRNVAYTVVINNVMGDGANNELDAYNNSDLLLDANVNNWTLDNAGNVLIDGEDVLVVTTSSIDFQSSPDSRSYNIFTSGPSKLGLSTQMLPEGITANLTGKTLTVTSQGGETPKEGYLDVTFGKLKATISVTQSNNANDFLTLSSYDNIYLAAEIGSKLQSPITVTSSGSWIAKIYKSDWLSFEGDNTSLNMIGGDNNENKTFKLFISKKNENTTERNAFVVVELANNSNIKQLLQVIQKSGNVINITPLPQSALEFSAGGNIKVANSNLFSIDAGEEPWSYKFDRVSTNFLVTKHENTIAITANQNKTNDIIDDRLIVYLTKTPSEFKTIDITQDKYTITFNPQTISSVAPSGGLSEAFKVDINDNPPYTISISNANGSNASVVNNGTTANSYKVQFPALTGVGSERSETVTVKIKDTDLMATMSVKQSAKSSLIIKPSPVTAQSNIQFTYTGTPKNSNTYTVETNSASWTCKLKESNSPFILTKAADNKSFTVTANTNKENAALSGTVLVYLDDFPLEITTIPITQAKINLDVTIAPSQVVPVPSTGGSVAFNITSDVPMNDLKITVTSSNSNINQPILDWNGTSSTFNIKFPAQTTPGVSQNATAKVSFKDANIKVSPKEVTATQSQKVEMTVTPTTDQTIAPDGGTLSYNVSFNPSGTGSDFTVSSNNSLFTVSKISGGFKVNANPNTTPNDITGIITVSMNGDATQTKTLNVKQSAYTIDVSPSSVTNVSASGGESQVFTVTTNSDPSDWTATITSNINNIEAKINLIGNNAFKVYFPQLKTIGLSPSVTVTVSHSQATAVKKMVTVTQNAIESTIIKFYSLEQWYGFLDPNIVPVDKIQTKWLEVLNPINHYFGSSDISQFKMNEIDFKTGNLASIQSYLNTIGLNPNILVFPCTSTLGFATSVGPILNNWRINNTKNFLIICADWGTNQTILNSIGLQGNWTSQVSGKEKIYKPYGSINNKKLYEYLFRDGPFTNGVEIFNNVSMKGGDGNEATLKDYATTMIPIFIDPVNGELMMGIDPTEKILYISNMEIFSTRNGAATTTFPPNQGNWDSDDSVKNKANLNFLLNVNAFLFNAVLYGDEFLNQFK